jgi:hypothetical protein
MKMSTKSFSFPMNLKSCSFKHYLLYLTIVLACLNLNIASSKRISYTDLADETVKGGLAERLKPILRSASPPVFWVKDRAQYNTVQTLGLAFL